MRRATGLVRHTAVAASLLIAAAGGAASAGTIRHDRDPQLYLDLGASPDYASVGKFDITKNAPGYAASGTLVGDDWVLTAAHPFDGATSGQFTVGGQTYTVSKWVTHPKWDGAYRRGFDLALVKLDAPVGGVTPARLYTGRRERGAVATFVGFGYTGDGLRGHVDYDGLKRAGQNVIDGTLGPEQWPLDATFRNKLPRNARTFIVDFDSPTKPEDSVTGDPTPADLEFLISPGDSGGGAFLDFGKGPLLAGVHSFAEVPDHLDNSDYGDVTGQVRVSAFAKWVRRTVRREDRLEELALRRELREAAGRGRMITPELATAVPEPASLGVMTLATLVLRRLPRRK